ncbi:MAG: hypothetical protein WAZ21_03770 [Candidatus Saccharimonadales bacterium]
MKQVIGVIGAAGDLGSQLVEKLNNNEAEVIVSDPLISHSASLALLLRKCNIIHVCAPLDQLGEAEWFLASSAMIILHDSTMDTSRRFSEEFLEGDGAIVHLLMNKHAAAVVASDAAHTKEVEVHLIELGYKVNCMSVDEHDRLMANSQAPLALLCRALLPSLSEQRDAGMLTTSGEDLIDALQRRQAAWTPETIQSILRNPQLPHLIDDMQLIMAEIGYNKR